MQRLVTVRRPVGLRWEETGWLCVRVEVLVPGSAVSGEDSGSCGMMMTLQNKENARPQVYARDPARASLHILPTLRQARGERKFRRTSGLAGVFCILRSADDCGRAMGETTWNLVDCLRVPCSGSASRGGRVGALAWGWMLAAWEDGTFASSVRVWRRAERRGLIYFDL